MAENMLIYFKKRDFLLPMRKIILSLCQRCGVTHSSH